MNRILVREINVSNEVMVSGWVHRIKKLKAVAFIILRDRSGYIQLALNPNDLGQIKLESVVTVTGKAIKSLNKYGEYEIQVKTIKVLSEVKNDLPITVNNNFLEASMEVVLNNRVLSLRHERERAIFKIQSRICQAFKEFLIQEDFTEIHTPKLVKEGAEGGSEVFRLDYFGETAYLAQSPQFYKQMMVISGLERVFEVGPVFRAESHSTVRHINEYTSMDMEMGFITSEEELMNFENKLLKYIFNFLEEKCQNELKILDIKMPHIPKAIPRLKLEEAVKIVNEKYNKNLEGDLDPEGEIQIHDYIYEKTGSEFVFLTHYPKNKRPMYTMADGSNTKSFDLLFRGLEITTGGLRIHDYETLVKSMFAKGLNPDNYESYLEAFKYGVPPHGGLAIGLERLTAKLLNIKNIRRATLFPRDKNRLTP